MANGELIILKRLNKIIKRIKTFNRKPTTIKVDKYINYYINNKKVLIDYKLASYKLINLNINKEN